MPDRKWGGPDSNRGSSRASGGFAGPASGHSFESLAALLSTPNAAPSLDKGVGGTPSPIGANFRHGHQGLTTAVAPWAWSCRRTRRTSSGARAAAAMAATTRASSSRLTPPQVSDPSRAQNTGSLAGPLRVHLPGSREARPGDQLEGGAAVGLLP